MQQEKKIQTFPGKYAKVFKGTEKKNLFNSIQECQTGCKSIGKCEKVLKSNPNCEK